MVVLFGVGCYVSSTSSCGKMVAMPVEVKFGQLTRLIRPPSIGDCLYEKPIQDVLFVTTVSMCKKNVSITRQKRLFNSKEIDNSSLSVL